MKHKNMNRRTFVTNSVAGSLILGAPAIVSAGSLKGGPLNQGKAPMVHGSMAVTEFKNSKIHSYISPNLTGCVTTHIIETPERLVIVDAQRSVIYGQEIREYAEKLAKPIDRMIISHLHPDHWFGAYQFRDVPIYSLKSTQTEIDELGEFFIDISKPSLGEHVPSEKVVPDAIIADGSSETIDGVTLEFSHVTDAESDNMLTINLPEEKVLIAQDLLYNNCHLFCGHGNFQGWAKSLKEMRNDTSYDLVMPGHGSNTGSRQAIDDALVYLEFVEQTYSKVTTGDELKAAIIDRYPSYLASSLVDIQNLFLFPKK